MALACAEVYLSSNHPADQLICLPLQVTVILACAELYFSSLSKLLEQRRVLQQQLKQADEGLSECQKRLRGVDGGINQLQVLDALASNLKREHVLRIMLNCFVWGRSLNSIQFAKTAVYSHPFFPDVSVGSLVYMTLCSRNPTYGCWRLTYQS